MIILLRSAEDHRHCAGAALVKRSTRWDRKCIWSQKNTNYAMQSKINTGISTHSLINQSIPPEILSTIFVDCIAAPMELEYYFGCHDQPPTTLSPLLLGRICRHWRDVAWSTPGLWHQLFVFVHSEQLGERASLFFDLACEWLDRSGDLPLSLFIQMEEDDNFYDSDKSFDHIHPVLQIVKLYSQRWRDLHLHMWTPCISQIQLDTTEIPILQTFKFWPIGTIIKPSWWKFRVTPRCVNFDVGDLGPSYSSSFFTNVNWDHLIDVTVDGFYCSYHIKILKLAPQLERFKIIDFLGNPLVESDQVVHLKLRSFSVIGNSSYDSTVDSDTIFLNFLLILHFPSLTELHYDPGFLIQPESLSPSYLPTVAAFLRRLKNLRSASIQLSLSMEGERYIDILKDWSSLESLCLIDRDGEEQDGNNSIESPLFFHLAKTYDNEVSSGSSKPFLPSLRTFGYRRRFREAPWTAILSVLGPLSEIGNSHRRPLKTLSIKIGYSAKNLEPAIMHQLAEAKNAGINIILKDDLDHEFEDNTNVFVILIP